MKALFLAGAALAVPLSAQVVAPSAPVSVPSTPVAVPTGPGAPSGVAPSAASRPQGLINPAAPTAIPPQAAGRTFQTPVVGGLPAPTTLNPAIDPTATIPPLGFPPVVAPGGAVSVTNSGIVGPFSTNFAVGAVQPLTVPAPVPPAFNTTRVPFSAEPAEPVPFDFPPGTVVRGTPGTGVRQTAPAAVGAAPSVSQGTSTGAPVVTPRR